MQEFPHLDPHRDWGVLLLPRRWDKTRCGPFSQPTVRDPGSHMVPWSAERQAALAGLKLRPLVPKEGPARPAEFFLAPWLGKWFAAAALEQTADAVRLRCRGEHESQVRWYDRAAVRHLVVRFADDALAGDSRASLSSGGGGFFGSPGARVRVMALEENEAPLFARHDGLFPVGTVVRARPERGVILVTLTMARETIDAWLPLEALAGTSEDDFARCEAALLALRAREFWFDQRIPLWRGVARSVKPDRVMEVVALSKAGEPHVTLRITQSRWQQVMQRDVMVQYADVCRLGFGGYHAGSRRLQQRMCQVLSSGLRFAYGQWVVDVRRLTTRLPLVWRGVVLCAEGRRHEVSARRLSPRELLFAAVTRDRPAGRRHRLRHRSLVFALRDAGHLGLPATLSGVAPRVAGVVCEELAGLLALEDDDPAGPLRLVARPLWTRASRQLSQSRRLVVQFYELARRCLVVFVDPRSARVVARHVVRQDTLALLRYERSGRRPRVPRADPPPPQRALLAAAGAAREAAAPPGPMPAAPPPPQTQRLVSRIVSSPDSAGSAGELVMLAARVHVGRYLRGGAHLPPRAAAPHFSGVVVSAGKRRLLYRVACYADVGVRITFLEPRSRKTRVVAVDGMWPTPQRFEALREFWEALVRGCHDARAGAELWVDVEMRLVPWYCPSSAPDWLSSAVPEDSGTASGESGDEGNGADEGEPRPEAQEL